MKTLLLCALVAGVGGAETQVVISTDVYHAWQETNKRIEKLEKRVAEIEKKAQSVSIPVRPIDPGISGFVPYVTGECTSSNPACGLK